MHVFGVIVSGFLAHDLVGFGKTLPKAQKLLKVVQSREKGKAFIVQYTLDSDGIVIDALRLP
jgi:hypothetical protein